MSQWISVQLKGLNIEEKCSLLFEFGISGANIGTDETACCYYLSEDGKLSPEFNAEVKRLELIVIETELLAEANWVQSCESLFEPLQAGTLNIRPVRSKSDAERTDFNSYHDLLIIPGTGFGTGHHASTYNLLKLMQHSALSANPPSSVLDAGSGSGILAIGACRLFDCEVEAYENDSLACENAFENIQINKLEARIKLFCKSVHHCENKYNLVVANLYAELLELLCSHLIERARRESHFLLSGIKIELAQGVINKYQAHGLSCLEKVDSDGWTSLLLKN